MAQLNEINDWQPLPDNAAIQNDDPGDWVEASPVPQEDKTSMLKSGVQGFGSGASFGFADELAGAVGSKIVDPIAEKFVPGYQADTYDQARDFARKSQDVAKADNPWTYGLSEVAGGIVGSAPLGGAISGATKAGKAAGSAMGLGRVGQAALGGAAAGAPLGAIYGAGSSEGKGAGDVAIDTLKGGGIGALSGAVFSGGLEGGRIVAEKVGDKIGAMGQKLRSMADDIFKPPAAGATKQNTQNVQKAIAKQISNLESQEAIPEAKILKDLSSGVGTPEGISARKSALMSPLTREEKNAQFFNETKKIYNTIEDDFRNFESNIRFKEAAANLADVPVEQTKPAIMKEIVNINTLGKEMSKGKKLYDQSAVGYVDAYTREAAKKLKNAATSAEVYEITNSLKKQLAELSKYGKDIDPMKRGTIERVGNMEKMLTNALENPKVFGDQANRHAAINNSYKKFLTSLENMQNSFTKAEAAETGRKIEQLSSTSMGTYSRQLDTIHGADRRRFLDEMLENAQVLANTIDESAAKVGATNPTPKAIQDYLPLKDQFTKEMTLSNQLRRLRWDDMVQQGATPGRGQVAAQEVGSIISPRLSSLQKIASAGVNEQQKSQDLIRQLLNKETQPSQTDKFIGRSVKGIGDMLKQAPQAFGKFSTVLQNAAAKGQGSLAAVNHVLLQSNPQYREIQNKLNGQEPDEENQ